ncbi:MAG: MGMT family protein [Patescibacteria group bacterium]
MAKTKSFKVEVQEIVRRIPRGRLMSYGQIATLLGHPRRAQAVGFVAHYGDADLPWHRVVNRHGRMAPGYPGGMPAHRAAVESEGIAVDPKEFTCDIERYRWWPPER